MSGNSEYRMVDLLSNATIHFSFVSMIVT